MLKETKNKIAASFMEQIKALKEEIKGIDEKYKKLAEEEKKELKEMLSYFKEQRDALLDGKKLVVVPEVAEETGETVEEKSIGEETEPDIVDSIFPENNEDEEEEEEESTDENEEVTEDVSEQETDSANQFDDIWPGDATAAEEKDAVSGDDWPEAPEEW